MISRNRQHLGQDQGTLFITFEVVQLISTDGCSKCIESLLHGNADTSDIKLTPLQRVYISNLYFKKNKGKNNIKAIVLVKDMKDGCTKWKESTSTSPFNRHLDHYTPLLASDGTVPNSSTNHFSEIMWHIFTSLTNFSIHTTQPLEHWNTTIAIMLEKDKGSPKINRSRVIRKYKTDYNLLLKLY